MTRYNPLLFDLEHFKESQDVDWKSTGASKLEKSWLTGFHAYLSHSYISRPCQVQFLFFSIAYGSVSDVTLKSSSCFPFIFSFSYNVTMTSSPQKG